MCKQPQGYTVCLCVEDRLMIDSSQQGSDPSSLEDAFFRAKYLIQIYAISQQLRPSVLTAAFGSDIDVEAVQWLIRQFEEGDFSAFPEVEARSRLALDGARSLYVPELNVIYLAEDFAASADRDELFRALVQEIINAVRFFSK